MARQFICQLVDGEIELTSKPWAVDGTKSGYLPQFDARGDVMVGGHLKTGRH